MIVNHNFPIFVCIEGIDGAGKSTLIANIRKFLFDYGVSQDVYIDRFVASNRMYDYIQELGSCSQPYHDLENILSGRMVYLFLDTDVELALERSKGKLGEVFSYEFDSLHRMQQFYDDYFIKCDKPVLRVDHSYDVADIVSLIDNHRMLLLAERLADNSCCMKRKNGSVLCNGSMMTAGNWNRVPSGCLDCVECLRLDLSGGIHLETCRSLHAEMLSLLEGSGDTIYTKYFPCTICARMLIECGIKKVFYRVKDNIDILAERWFTESGVGYIRL